MTRSSIKGPYVDPYLWNEIFKKKKGLVKKFRKDETLRKNKSSRRILVKVLKIRSRGSVIFPALINRSFGVYNGLRFLRVTIKKSMVGHKFGEFAFTRRKHVYKSKRKGKKK